MQTTSNLGLKKPGSTDVVDIDDFNGNADTLDGKFGASAGHGHTGTAGDGPKIGSSGLAAGAATDAVIGNRTVSDATAPTGDSGTVTTLFGWVANMIKAITGKSNWRTVPSTTLEAANTHHNATTAHSATSTATASRMMTRDAAGRSQVADPSVAADIANKGYVDTVVTGAAVPDASLTVKGKVQLSSATNSTSEALAATAKAVKDAYDRGSAGVTAAATAQAKADAALPLASYTAADVLAKVKTVDGAGSGLDADTLDGKHLSEIQVAKLAADDGSSILLASGFDINSLKATGFYRGDAAINRPPVASGNPSSWFLYQVISHDPSWVTQVAYEYGPNNIYQRNCAGGTWLPWTKNWNTETLRDNSGMLEFYTGGEWRPVGGATYVASGTYREGDVTERAFTSPLAASFSGMLVYKFIPRHAGEVVITADLYVPPVSSAWRTLLIGVAPYRSIGSNGLFTTAYNNSVWDYRAPVGSVISNYFTFSNSNYETMVAGTAGQATAAKIYSGNYNAWTTVGTTFSVFETTPIYFFLVSPSVEGRVKNIRFYYDIV